MKELTSSIGIKGWLKIEVLDHTGKVIESRPTQRNLLLDQGLNQMAERSIVDTFKYAIKGTGTSAVVEKAPADGVTYINKYVFLWATNNVGRETGSRQFTAADVGKIIYPITGPGTEPTIPVPVRIYDFYPPLDGSGNSPGVLVEPVGNNPPFVAANAFSGTGLTFYSAHETEVDGEPVTNSRTNAYGVLAGDNSTVVDNEITTHKRTFIFGPETEKPEPKVGTYSWSATTKTVTVVSGSFFSLSDKDKYIEFGSTGEYAKITAVAPSTASCTVDRDPINAIVADASVVLYGRWSYGQIGFSHTDVVGPNANILVRLEDSSGASKPVEVLGGNPETPGQQIRVIYTMQITWGPSVVPSTNTAINIPDPDGVMSGTKSGKAVIEALSNSTINPDGASNNNYVALEPFAGGAMAMSKTPTHSATVPANDALNGVSTAADPFDRSPGAAVVDMTPGVYVANKFTRLCAGTFGIADAVEDDGWWTMGIFDPAANAFCFTILFTTKQRKPGTHALTLRFRKTWARDFS